MSTTEHSELTARLGKVAKRELAGRGIVTYEQLTTQTRAQLLAIHGVGPKAVRILVEELAERGLSLADD